MKSKILTLIFSALLSSGMAQKSPDGRICASIDGGCIKVEVSENGKSQKLFTINAGKITGEGESYSFASAYDMILGKKSRINVSVNRAEYSLSDGNKLIVHVQNDGVAYRKVGEGKVEDKTTVDFSLSANSWLMEWRDSYEDFFVKNRSLSEGMHLGFPSLFEFRDGVFVLMSESDLNQDNSASSLYVESANRVFGVSSGNGASGVKQSSWKTMIVGSLSDIVESTLITDLAEPCKLASSDWIKPGVASWVYWANNHGSNDFNIIKKYVDMAVALKLPYVLIDAEWDEMKDGKSVEDAVKYAVDNNVKPMIWYNSSIGWVNGAPGPKFRLNKPEDLEMEFAWCESIGVKGVKIDFFSGDDNRNVRFMIDLLQAAERHHLVVNFHGATIPRGWQRTYPNLVSTEGVYGAEWYNNVPTFTDKAASHNATLPFTRNVVGSMDYTPCAFSDSQHPHITTHAHELALTALFESGIQHLADRPESFLAQPDEVKAYLGKLPAAWDDTKLLSGYPGESVVLARRKGSSWYIAGINGTDDFKVLEINTSRLGKLGKKVQVFADGENSGEWNISSSKKKIPTEINCKPRGGFVIVVE